MNPQEFEVDFGEVTTGGEVTGVSSVNGKTGDVVLNASDVNALPDSTVVPTKTSNLTNDGSDGTSTYVEADELAAVATTGDYTDLRNKPTIPSVNDATLTVQKNGTSVGTFTANSSTNKTINITVPTQASDISALPASTKYAASLDLSINSSTYVVTGQLKDQDGNNIGSAQTIDLPLESVVVGGSYDSQTKKVVLTLQSGDTIEFSVADLVDGLQTEITSSNKLSADLVDDTSTTNKFASDSQLTKLDGLANVKTIGTNLNLDANGELTATDTTYTAGTNVSISANNEISATDTTYSAFTGTDGQTAGTSGLVPAPATTDAGKFLKADGTWDTAGGGGGGDAVYSTKTTSNDSSGGAVYIGDKDANQDVVADPTTTDKHYKYFWSLPGYNVSPQIPSNRTINIMGVQKGNNDDNISIGWNATVDTYCNYNIAIGNQVQIASNNNNVVIGMSASSTGQNNTVLGQQARNLSYSSNTIAIGKDAITGADGTVVIGQGASSYSASSVALGKGAYPTRQGEVNVSCDNTTAFNNTTYRVIGGVYDGQTAHDVATVGQINATIDAINTALNTNIPHIGA